MVSNRGTKESAVCFQEDERDEKYITGEIEERKDIEDDIFEYLA